MTCPLNQPFCLGPSCMHHASRSVLPQPDDCAHAQVVNLAGDEAATAAYYGLSTREVRRRAGELRLFMRAVLFAQHVTETPVDQLTSRQLEAVTEAESAWDQWSESEGPFSVIQPYLVFLANRLNQSDQEHFNHGKHFPQQHPA